MAATKLTAGNSVNDATSFTTGIVAPSADNLVLLFVANTRPFVPGGPSVIPTARGNGLTWEQVQTVTTADNDRRLTCFRAMGSSPTATSPTVISIPAPMP